MNIENLLKYRKADERIVELANDIDHFIVDVVYYLFNNNGRFL